MISEGLVDMLLKGYQQISLCSQSNFKIKDIIAQLQGNGILDSAGLFSPLSPPFSLPLSPSVFLLLRSSILAPPSFTALPIQWSHSSLLPLQFYSHPFSIPFPLIPFSFLLHSLPFSSILIPSPFPSLQFHSQPFSIPFLLVSFSTLLHSLPFSFILIPSPFPFLQFHSHPFSIPFPLVPFSFLLHSLSISFILIPSPFLSL